LRNDSVGIDVPTFVGERASGSSGTFEENLRERSSSDAEIPSYYQGEQLKSKSRNASPSTLKFALGRNRRVESIDESRSAAGSDISDRISVSSATSYLPLCQGTNTQRGVTSNLQRGNIDSSLMNWDDITRACVGGKEREETTFSVGNGAAEDCSGGTSASFSTRRNSKMSNHAKEGHSMDGHNYVGADSGDVSPQEGRRESVRVLVVDDTVSIQRVMKRWLEKRGCIVTLASDGQEAVDKLKTESFDTVFMDFMMVSVAGRAILC